MMTKKPKVVLLGKLPPPYMGPSLATQIILNSSLKESIELIHVDTKAYDSLSELGKFSVKKTIRNISIYLRLLKKCTLNRPQLVLVPISQTTSGFIKDSIFILIAKLCFIKVLLQLRGSDFKRWYDGAPLPVRWYVRFIMSLCEGIIVLGNSLVYLFKDFFTENNIYVSPNGANYEIPKQRKRSNEVKILYLANLQASKGIEDLLEAVKKLKERGITNFYLDVVGGWRTEITKNDCTQFVESNQLPVTFYPPSAGADKFRHLGEADIFVFTPRAPEGHPWVLVESMCAGLPIIGTDRGAMAESIMDNKNGFIVGIQSPNEIADKLQLLIKDEELRLSMGKESRQLYLTNFTEEKMVERLKNIFLTVINK